MQRYPTTTIIIDRDEEKKKVQEALRAIRADRTPRAIVLEFYGLAGLGKTRLLKENREQCRQAGVPFAFADLSGARTPDQLMDHLMRQLDLQGFMLPNGLEVVFDAYWHATGEANLQPVANEFVRYLEAILHRPQLLALILDTTNACSESFLQWLSRDILLPLCGYNRLLVILAGRAKVEDWAPEFRQVPESFEIKPFTVQETEEHIRHLPNGAQYAPAAKEVQKLTWGHPYSNEAIVYWLNQLGIDASHIVDNRVELARCLRTAIIEGYIMKSLEPWLHSLLEVAAIPRRFDGYVLKTLIANFLPELDGNRPMQYYIVRIADLIGTRLVSAKPAYQADKLLRQMQGTYLVILEPDRFKALHTLMAGICEEELQQKKRAQLKPDVDLEVERIYHLAQLLWLQQEQGATIDFAQELCRSLQQDLAAYFVHSEEVDEIKVMELSDALQKDEEIVALIFPAISQMVETVERFRRRPVVTEKVYLTITKEAGSQLEISLTLPDQPVVGARLINVHTWPELEEVRQDLAGVGQLMYGQYLPINTQQRLMEVRAAIQIVTNHADVPWELMHDGQDFLCLRVPVGRFPKMVQEPRRNPSTPGETPRFLLIGDPTDDLPAARQEVEDIVSLLGDRIEPTILEGEQATSLRFLKELATNEYDVIHFAGHGHFEGQNSRLLLAGRKQVAGEEIERGLRRGRPFVFLNACEAGKAQSGRLRHVFLGSFTEGLAISVLLGGALGCIGPLWKIGDRSAADLAVAFYTRLIEGDPVGEALRQARLKIKIANPTDDLWAAWVLYGDPILRLTGFTKGGQNQ